MRFAFAALLSALAGFASVNAQAQQVVFNLTDAVKAKFPDGEILMRSQVCGPQNAPFAGLIVKQADGLHAIFGVFGELGWVTFDVSRDAETASADIKDFLDEFIQTNQTDMPEPRCAVPGQDDDITPDANAEFTDAAPDHAAQLICFPASFIYNNWVCYAPNPKDLTPVIAFEQFHAD